jgi:quinol-cytochrome oxidoreductase complex cytochrome b subunit
MRPSFFEHLHPPTIPAKQSRLRYTLGAGGISVYLILVLMVTGALEMFYYVPTAEEAALSVQKLTFLVPLGGVVRNMHYWAAQGLVVVSLLHLARVVLAGAYSHNRRFNYLLGLCLFILVLLLDFSGYLLRWDVDIQWMLTTSTNLLKTIPGVGDSLFRFVVGGEEYGTATVIRLYSWHLYGLAVGMIVFGFWHLFRVRRDGGLAVPPPAERDDRERISRRELVRRELTAALIVTGLLFLMSILLPAPIAAPMGADLAEPASPLAPWFFLWVQGMLHFGDPFLWGVVVPLGLLAILVAIAYLFPQPSPEELGRWWPRGGLLAQVTLGLILLFMIVMTWIALNG